MDSLDKDKIALEKTLKMFELKDGNMVISNNAFFYLHTALFLHRAMSSNLTVKNPLYEKLYKTYGEFGDVQQDIWNISTNVYRLEFIRKLAEQDSTIPWNVFASLDIEHIHFDLRSIMDYVARIISALADKPKQTPDSFEDLMNDLSKGKHVEKLEPETINLIKGVYWFMNLRNVRNAIKKDGAQAVVFERPSKGILFQINKNFYDKLINETLVFDEGTKKNGIVDFKKYMALYFARLLCFLDELGEIYFSKYTEFKKSPGYTGGPGFSLLYQWMQTLLKELENSNQPNT